MNAIILAGGRATRLGPLAAQLNKCLITAGQQPMLVHQVNLLRQAGVTEVVVVASEQSRLQVEAVAAQAYRSLYDVRITVITQSRGLSPVNALVDGLEWLLANTQADAPCFVLAADTLVDRIPVAPGEWAHTVSVTHGMLGRSWTLREANGMHWSDRPGFLGEYVYTGLMKVQSVGRSYATLAPRHASEMAFPTSMALNMLNLLPYFQADDPSNWQDVGDLDALAEARRTRYIARDSHSLELDDDGIVWKIGNVAHEVNYFTDLPPAALNMFPRLHGTSPTAYGTDHIDQPTLAELWLYWPGDTSTWTSIISRLCKRMERTMWRHHWSDDWDWMRRQAVKMYVDQLVERLHGWKHPIFDEDELVINDMNLIAGRKLVELMRPHVVRVAQDIKPGIIHGDLSFMNVLWSITTGQPKLLDPRGLFGKQPGHFGDIRYDLAKLRYSYHGGIAAFLHGLYDTKFFSTQSSKQGVELRYAVGPITTRNDLAVELDAIIGEYAPIEDVRMIEAVMCLSGSTVHSEREALALYTRGVQLANLTLSLHRMAGYPATASGRSV